MRSRWPSMSERPRVLSESAVSWWLECTPTARRLRTRAPGCRSACCDCRLHWCRCRLTSAASPPRSSYSRNPEQLAVGNSATSKLWRRTAPRSAAQLHRGHVDPRELAVPPRAGLAALGGRREAIEVVLGPDEPRSLSLERIPREETQRRPIRLEKFPEKRHE